MNDVMVVEVFDTLYDLARVVYDGWFVVFEGAPFLTKEFGEAACVCVCVCVCV